MAREQLSPHIERLDLAQLRHAETNARYMTPEQHQRLVENLREDGALTSAPLVWLIQDENGKITRDKHGAELFEILSGNHRVAAARDAELDEADCIVIREFLTRERRTEIQLSHNAINGQDDLSVLQQLYEDLGLDSKAYSGITDDWFKDLKEVNVSGLGAGAPEYQEMLFAFLPADKDFVSDTLKTLEQHAQKREVVAAHIADYDRVFDAIVAVKEHTGIQNGAIAMAMMAELALRQIEAESNGGTQAEAKA